MMTADNDKQKRHEKLEAFLTELASVAVAFRWFVSREGEILGRYVECERVRPFTPLTAVAFMGTELMVHDDVLAAKACGLIDIIWEIDKASESSQPSNLRKALLKAVGLKE
jgi:hypothetical protein